MMVAVVAEALAGRLQGRVEADFDLAGLTTYRLGGPAALYVEPATAADVGVLAEVLGATAAAGAPVEVLALGRGSNLVVSDAGWPGVVVRLGAAFSWISPEPGGPPEGLVTGAATALPQLANWAARRGFAGLEFTVAIPGAVGGAIRMNAGAHGGQISDHLFAATVFDLGALAVEVRYAARLELSYRRSNLTENDLVLDATFRLRSDDPEAIRARMAQFRAHRAASQPGAVQNAGSVFKNPPGDSAGRLIEAAGLKGLRVGGAEVSHLHANFFVASDDARAQDVHDLVGEVRARVKEATGVELEPEIRFVGPFG